MKLKLITSNCNKYLLYKLFEVRKLLRNLFVLFAVLFVFNFDFFFLPTNSNSFLYINNRQHDS